MSLKSDYDLCVIGGGINGAGIARDAAGRDLSVLLVEAKDLASATSSSSSKLIHGGLRYLEHFEFKLVRESLREREILLRNAPHIVWPMGFVLPHDRHQRPYPLIRAGLYLYDALSRDSSLPRSKGVSLRGGPLKESFSRGIRYSDCWVEDSRLVVLNAMSAVEKGADILTYTVCTGLQLSDDRQSWLVQLEGQEPVKARAVINAAGPWVGKFLDGLEPTGKAIDQTHVPQVRMVKGSHIVVPCTHDGDETYILQQKDGRIVFVIPFERNHGGQGHAFTLIGTTEEDYQDDPRAASISDEERQYLIDAYNDAFKHQISAADIRWDYSGVRPLFHDGEENASAVTRDYKIHAHLQYKPPLISVFGGKLTTYRALAEEVVNRLQAMKAQAVKPWTAHEPLPGGDIGTHDMEAFLEAQSKRYPWLDPKIVERYVWSYGTLMNKFLTAAQSTEDLGVDYGDGIYEAEIKYLVRHEFVRTLEDMLWRRSKLGLHIGDQTRGNLEQALPGILQEGP